jgi:hypothetical protein
MSHGDKVTSLPEGFHVTATSDNAPYAGIANEDKKFYAVQFHPEVAHTPIGKQLLYNFTHNIAGCSGDWTMKAFHEMEIEKVKAQVGDGQVICGLSGGVDSSVVAVLLHEAIGHGMEADFNRQGISVFDFFSVLLKAVPAFLGITIPMSFVLAVLIVFIQMGSNNELVALKSCGVSLQELSKPVFALGVFFSLLSFLSLFVCPFQWHPACPCSERSP